MNRRRWLVRRPGVVRTVETDPDRAPLITWAFTAYASGEWTLNTLLNELTVRGLTSVPTPRRPSKPIHVSTLHRTLQNPYYKGTIIFEG
ncbi:recombinase family protein [Brevibacterium sp.]|nr:recombinase family protein [Brevibacterium sp.]